MFKITNQLVKKFNVKTLIFLLLIIGNSLTLKAQVYPVSDPSNTGNWVLNSDISDEFEEANINEDKWLIQGRIDENGNPEYQSGFIGRVPSQFSTDNAVLENGKLKILTKWEPSFPFTTDASGNQLGVYVDGNGNQISKPITTAAVISKQQFQYGYMEIKSKAADAEITSSFWTTGPGGPVGASELDMFEMFGGHKTSNSWRKRLKFNIISWDPNNSIKQAATAAGQAVGTTHTRNIQADSNTADDFHVYGFEWTADYIKVYIDGVLHPDGTILKSEITNNGTEPDRWVTDVPYWVWFDSETFPWLGLPDESDLLTPAEYQIEYIRVWQTNAQLDQVSIEGTIDAAEPDTDGEFTVSLPDGVIATEDIVINYNVGGTATEGADFTNLAGVVTILNGSNSALIPILISDDNDVEGNETVIITLTSVSVGTFNSTPAEIDIADKVTGTILTAGDIAIVGWRAEGISNGAVAFMLLKDIVSNTKISFSNRSWRGTQNGWIGDYTIDDVWTWTSASSHSIGDILLLDSDGQVKRVNGGVEEVVGTTSHDKSGKTVASDDDTNFGLSNNGDSILVYQVYGVFVEPTNPLSNAWIAGINTNGGWGTGGGNTFCALPTALTNGLNANVVGSDQDNGVYTAELLGSASSLRTSINNSANWISDDDTNYNLWSYAESIGANYFGNIGSAGTLSVSGVFLRKSIKIYPNPINTSLYRNLNISSPDVKKIILYSINGAQLLSVDKNSEPYRLPVDKLKSGVYFISVVSNEGTQTKKIIIK